MIPTFIASTLGQRPRTSEIADPATENLQFAIWVHLVAPTYQIGSAAMKRIFSPALTGFSAVRHLAWYLGYHAAGSRHDFSR
jgi:hypothetical protein